MKIADRQIDVVVDTGAERSILSKKWASQIGMDCDNKPAVRLKGAFNAPPPTDGRIMNAVKLQIGVSSVGNQDIMLENVHRSRHQAVPDRLDVSSARTMDIFNATAQNIFK